MKSGMPRATSSIILICNSSFPDMDAELYLSKLGEESVASVSANDDCSIVVQIGLGRSVLGRD